MRLAVLAILVLVVAGCDAAPGPTGSSGSPPTAGSVTASPPASMPRASRPPSPTAALTATVSPTEAASDPPEPDPSMFLQVCRAFPGARSSPPLPCEDAVRAALDALSIVDPRRVDVRFACRGAPGCDRADPNRAFVTVDAVETDTEVEITRGADGTVEATATRPGSAVAPPAFDPPPVGLADIPDAPASVARRTAYPLCGREDTSKGGPYDDAARTCFLTGVLAGSPVEFVSAGAGTEGQGYVHLYRYAGEGGIEVVNGEGGEWRRSFTGIAEASGGLVFDVGGMSTRPEPAR